MDSKSGIAAATVVAEETKTITRPVVIAEDVEDQD